jgi:hypothetical protein
MPIITTDKLGLDTANPKPVRGVNWCGNPMKEGDSYWGESEPQPSPPPREAPKARVQRVKRSWTATQLEAMRERMAKARAAAAAKRSAAQSTAIGEN